MTCASKSSGNFRSSWADSVWVRMQIAVTVCGIVDTVGVAFLGCIGQPHAEQEQQYELTLLCVSFKLRLLEF